LPNWQQTAPARPSTPGLPSLAAGRLGGGASGRAGACTGTCFFTFFRFNYQGPQEEKRGLRGHALDLFADGVQNRAPLRRRKAAEQGVQLGFKEANGNLRNKVGEDVTEGDEGLEGVAGAAVDGAGDEAEVIG